MQKGLADQLESLRMSTYTATTMEEFFRRKGMIEVLITIVGYEAQFRADLETEAMLRDAEDI